jgi:chromosomal replication initiator protein
MQGVWERLLSSIEKKVSKQTFETWFLPISPIDASGEGVVVGVPNRFFKEWLLEHHLSMIQDELGVILGKECAVRVETTKEGGPQKRDPKDILSEKEKVSEGILKEKNLNLRYTFDNFVVGGGNQFAHAAATAVANSPATTYNPLFIYGGVGLGKTHLLNAIGHHAITQNTAQRVCYITSERFTNELISSIRYQKTTSFRDRYRNVDVLLLDDVQFIAGKERTQEEFFHTFNSLYESKGQIVLTSDKFPKEIPGLEERLRSRFEWGLIADIQPPDTETKVAILKKKALLNNISLPNDVAFFLASNVKSNVRELEGFLIRLGAYSSFAGVKISMELAKDILKDLLKIKRKVVSVDLVLKEVSRAFNVKISDIKSNKKHKSIVLPRQICMYLLKKLTDLSFPEIGQVLGGKNHSTIIYGVKKVEGFMGRDSKIKSTVEKIEGVFLL